MNGPIEAQYPDEDLPLGILDEWLRTEPPSGLEKAWAWCYRFPDGSPGIAVFVRREAGARSLSARLNRAISEILVDLAKYESTQPRKSLWKRLLGI